MRNFINTISRLFESEEPISTIRKTIIDLVKQTEEHSILRRVLKTLETGNLDERIHALLMADADAKIFVKQITQLFVHSEAPLKEKIEFLDKYPKGILDVSKLLDGKEHSFSELVGKGFPTELFVDLSVNLISQGVGPGEIALAVFSPQVKWSGRAAGGGDVIIDGKNVEVKTSVKSGGRWINSRKANMNMQAIREAIEVSTGLDVPDRLGIPAWIDTYRPAIPKQNLEKVAKIIAKGIFTSVDTADFESSLIHGDIDDIKNSLLSTGFENYKKLSGFDGMLMMDIKTEMAQYFTSYQDMKDKVKIDVAYLYAPENEVMPKVSLRVSNPDKELSTSTNVKQRAKRTQTSPDLTKAADKIALGKSQQVSGQSTGAGREKRK